MYIYVYVYVYMSHRHSHTFLHYGASFILSPSISHLTPCSAKIFLPETHKHSYGIINEVEKVHLEQSEQLTAEDCINDLIQGCEKLATMSGVFFEVAEPVKSDILKVIPWNKMERRWFGISTNGIFGIDKETEEVGVVV